jgi:hypothetical protein
VCARARAEITFADDDGDEALEVLTSAETLATLLTLPAIETQKKRHRCCRQDPLVCVRALSRYVCTQRAPKEAVDPLLSTLPLSLSRTHTLSLHVCARAHRQHPRNQ